MPPRLDNSEIAAVFAEMADLTHIIGGNPHRIRSFRRAARVIENLPEDVATLIRFGRFEKTPGIGPGTLRRTKEILRTGTCTDQRRLRAQLPPGLREMLEVKGIGASTARRLWQHLKVGSIDQLEWAIRTGRLSRVPRMGQRTAEKLLKSIADYRVRVGRLPYIVSRRAGMRLVEALSESSAVQQIALTGSVRRGKATIGDLDILVASDDGLAVTSAFVTLPAVEEVLVHGEGRASVRLDSRQQCDIRVLPPENWGAGLHYFTGSQLHNIAIRARGLKVAGLKISDKGIFLRDTEVRVDPGLNEEAIFAAVGLPWIPPELRENTGEIEAAAAGRLPRLVGADDLKGDLHMHTVASDGRGTAVQMAEAAARLGHDYIAITDHTHALSVANGLDERRLLAQVHHLRTLQDQLGRLRVAAGTEVDILPDGSLDLDLDVLRRLDWVVASAHSALDMDGDAMTDRLIAAMETGVVDCLGHPTNRRLGQRPASELDMGRLLKVARRLGVAVEVNGNPYRMDLSDINCRKAKEVGVPVAVNTDAHAPQHLARQEFGLVTARRGWLEPRDVLNCQPWDVLADRRRDRFRSRGWAVPERLSVPSPAPSVQLYPDAPAAHSEHWPEPDEVAAGTDAAAPSPAESPEALAARLQTDLDDPLRERVETWLRTGEDPPLEAALSTLGDNPMQTAFNLVYG